MDVVVNVGGEVVVDNMGDIGDIETAGSNSSRHHDRAASIAEEFQCSLTLALGAIAMDGGGGEALIDEEIRQRVRHALGFDKDQRQAGAMGVKDVQQRRTLVEVLDILNLLRNVLRGGTNTANREEDVVLQEVASKHLDVTGERGREHESLAVVDRRHVLALHNTANLGFETHVKHAVSFIQDQVLDVAKRDTATLEKVDQTTRSGNQQVAATLNLTQLGANIGTSVHNAGTNPGAVSEFPTFLEDLGDELTGRGEDERGGISLALTTIAELTSSLRRQGGGSVLVSLGQDGEQETASLSGASLGTGHQITAVHDNRDGVLLNGSRSHVASGFDVGKEMVIQRGVRKGVGRLGDIVAGSFHGDIIVVGEVDTSRDLARIVGKEFAFQTRVGRAGDVLAVTPLAISRATLGKTAAAAIGTAEGARVTWVSVSIWIKWLTRTCLGTPVGVTIWTSRAEIVGIGPAIAGSTSARTLI